MLNFIDSSDRDTWLWATKGKTLDPHFDPGLYEAFGGGKLAVLVKDSGPVMAQPFYKQSDVWIGNAYNFGGPVGESHHAAEFSNAFDLWKSKEGLNERCTLNPVMRQVTGRAEDVISRPLVYVDLLSPLALRATTRHSIKRAETIGTKCALVDRTRENAGKFERIYKDLMTNKCAAPHWLYPDGFFYRVLSNLPDNSALFLTTVGGTVEAGCLLLWSPGVCYYHWAASLRNYPRDGINHLQVWSVINWALDKRFQWLILGGGLAPDDGLFKFKAGFSEKRLPCISYVTYAQKVVS